MKRIFNLFAIALFLNLNAFADQKEIITFVQLPQAAQDVVSQNFNQSDISYVTKERGWSVEFEVRFTNGTEIEFDSDGALKKIDCQGNPIPEALLPAEVVTYVKTNFPGASIKEWGTDDGEYEAELNNGLKLKFDNSYRFKRIDN